MLAPQRELTCDGHFWAVFSLNDMLEGFYVVVNRL